MGTGKLEAGQPPGLLSMVQAGALIWYLVTALGGKDLALKKEASEWWTTA